MIRKGDSIEVIKGKYRGETGEVFWAGMSKFNKERLGVETDGGEKIWIAPFEAKLAGPAAPAPAPAAPAAITATGVSESLEARVALLEATVKLLTLALAEVAPKAASAAAAPPIDASYTVEDLRAIEEENAGLDAEMAAAELSEEYAAPGSLFAMAERLTA